MTEPAPRTRTATEVRAEIEAEREQLVGAVDSLRAELTVTAVKLKKRVEVGAVVAGGVGAALYLLRHGRSRSKRR
jgi:hypothetical protein